MAKEIKAVSGTTVYSNTYYTVPNGKVAKIQLVAGDYNGPIFRVYNSAGQNIHNIYGKNQSEIVGSYAGHASVMDFSDEVNFYNGHFNAGRSKFVLFPGDYVLGTGNYGSLPWKILVIEEDIGVQ